MAFGFPKFKDGKPLEVHRHEKRRAREAYEDEQKAIARRRDQKATRTGCRWPDCPYCPMKLRKEVAHVWDKGMGGDHGIRSSADQLITLCHLIHQGPDSIHSGHREVKPRFKREGTNGPCRFYHNDKLVGTEIRPGVLEPR